MARKSTTTIATTKTGGPGHHGRPTHVGTQAAPSSANHRITTEGTRWPNTPRSP